MYHSLKKGNLMNQDCLDLENLTILIDVNFSAYESNHVLTAFENIKL